MIDFLIEVWNEPFYRGYIIGSFMVATIGFIRDMLKK